MADQATWQESLRAHRFRQTINGACVRPYDAVDLQEFEARQRQRRLNPHPNANDLMMMGAGPSGASTLTDLALLPGLVAWWRFGEIAKLWKDTAGTDPVTADADLIARVDDKSGNGYHITQATSGNRPSYRENITNGKGVALFDATDDFMVNTSFPDFGDEHYCFAVCKPAATSDRCIFEVSNGSTNTGFFLASHASINYRSADSASWITVDGSDYLGGSAFHVVCGRTPDMAYQIDGVDNGTPSGAYVAPNPNTLNRIKVGALEAGAWFFSEYICEILIGTGPLSNTNRTAATNILKAFYGVA